jgi:CheY-like chemotaxis protein
LEAPHRSDEHLAPAAQGQDTRLDGVRVVAVDDDPDATSLMQEVLEAAGASVIAAHSGPAALSILTRERADVLLADIGMPGMDGFSLIAKIRASADPAIREMPAAALTAYARSEDRVRALKSGFQMHLAKPIDPTELVAAVLSLAMRTTKARPPA